MSQRIHQQVGCGISVIIIQVCYKILRIHIREVEPTQYDSPQQIREDQVRYRKILLFCSNCVMKNVKM